MSFSDIDGGAARAAYRLHRAQLDAGLDSRMLVVNKLTNDRTVISLSKKHRIRNRINNILSNITLNLFSTGNPVKHSLNLLPTGVGKVINKINPDVVNLHWIGSDMISIKEITNIKAKVVWTLHDMWAFSGCEHYDDYPLLERYKSSYRKTKKVFFDINRFSYKLKRKKFSNIRISFVTPSKWLSSCLLESKMAEDDNINVIQNCINHISFSCIDKDVARNLLGLPKNKKLIAFGAMTSTEDKRKGFHLLSAALQHIINNNENTDFEFAVFGGEKYATHQNSGVATHHLGVLKDELSLNILYSAADLYVAPSLQDNLPNTIVEALACGTPCIAFNIGGMPDLISDESLGILVNEINEVELAKSISVALNREYSKMGIRNISKDSREDKVIVNKYLEVYKNG